AWRQRPTRPAGICEDGQLRRPSARRGRSHGERECVEPVVRSLPSAGGRVTSDIGGIDCGSDCVATFNAGTAVELTATADSGYVFVHWQSDACDSGSDICAHCDATPVCDVTLLAATEMRAVFRDPSRSAGAFVVSPDDTV